MVLVGVVPAILGGPIFALVWAIICAVGYREFIGLASHGPRLPVIPWIGYVVIGGAAIAPFVEPELGLVLLLITIAVWFPLVGGILRPGDGTFEGWALTIAGTLYLSLPSYSGIALRARDDSSAAAWLDSLADAASMGWSSAPRGLGWFLFVLLVTWIGDTAAYLIGRQFGSRPLIPSISPKKTFEGSLGGLLGAAVTGIMAAALFGLDIHPLLAAGAGLTIGCLGQIGDLGESLLKRQVGVKDSGNLIPGHGGMLDRIDATLLTMPAGLLLSLTIDRVVV